MIKRIVIKGYRLFDDFELVPNPGTNIIVGDNESGKSSLLEAISLALTGRVNGRWAQDELNPYWFNNIQVAKYFESLTADEPLPAPEILIELYLADDRDDLQYLLGVHNSLHEKSPGVRVHISPNPAYAEEFRDYLDADDRPSILPTEWYKVEWRQFSDEPLTRRPKELGVSVIDSRTVRSAAGVDYHTREMLKDFIEPSESAAVAVAHRKARDAISAVTLKTVNDRIAATAKGLHDSEIGLHMDQSSSASWENSIVPHVAHLPFALAGQGQQAAIKVALAMSRSADTTAYVLVEEPENHLSHTSLSRLVARIEKLAGSRQVFLTTHSSFVLNRLGLDKLVLLHRGTKAQFSDLPDETVRYFQRLSGYDTLRMVLARKVVLVEGPSDEMVFERAFRDAHDGRDPMAHGVDVIEVGLSYRRGLELCAALNRHAAVLRDNDDKDPGHWRDPVAHLLEAGRREIFIGEPTLGKTLEPQFAGANSDEVLRELFGLGADNETSTIEWMSANKTEWALLLAERPVAVLAYPKYIADAVAFIS